MAPSLGNSAPKEVNGRVMHEVNGKADCTRHGSDGFTLRWLVRISNWYPSKEEWNFLIELLPTLEQRKVNISFDVISNVSPFA